MVGRDFRSRCRSRGPGGWVTALAVGAVWWWAAVRLVAQPDRGGPVEALVVAGGWGLSLLPVHCVPWTRRRRGRREASSSAVGSAVLRALRGRRGVRSAAP
ncbi:hypothetical protein ABZ951_23905 [Streptomyces sp. NPDC046215]|uniref:Integral membrane protein n=1 Tax=Streptomyces stramineus TaxID=173861 RepID=A0ABP3JX68_9ACTN